MKTLLFLLSTVGVLFTVVVFAGLWLRAKLREIDEIPHGTPPKDWVEGYDD